jgi:hypothetical protein
MSLETHNPFTQFVAAQLEKPVAKAKVKQAAVEKPARNTKKSAAIELFRTLADKKAVIAAYKSQLDMTDAGANSYYYAIKKQLA